MNVVFLNNKSLSLAISGNIILFVAGELAQTFCVNRSVNEKKKKSMKFIDQKISKKNRNKLEF